jgi:hypothetical protein
MLGWLQVDEPGNGCKITGLRRDDLSTIRYDDGRRKIVEGGRRVISSEVKGRRHESGANGIRNVIGAAVWVVHDG